MCTTRVFVLSSVCGTAVLRHYYQSMAKSAGKRLSSWSCYALQVNVDASKSLACFVLSVAFDLYPFSVLMKVLQCWWHSGILEQ